MRISPLSLAIWVGGKLGRLAYYLPLRERIIAEWQVRRFLPGSPTDTVHRLFEHLGLSTVETTLCPHVLRHGSFTCEGWELVEDEYQAGRGVVALTGHLGNWDLLAGYVGSRGVPLYAIGREARRPLVQKLLQRLRDASSVKMLWRDGLSGGREIVRLLQSGNTVAALIDQDTTVRSEWVPFLGVPAKTPSTFAQFALSTNSAIVSAFLVRLSPLSYRVSIRRIADRSSVRRILGQYHAHLEELLREYPEQWVWIHKRWRTPEGGKTMSSAEYLSWLTAPSTEDQGMTEQPTA